MSGPAQLEKKERRLTAEQVAPELKEFIDCCLVPILVRECLSDIETENSLALAKPPAQNSHPTVKRRARGGSIR
jgi:hypothetical protein